MSRIILKLTCLLLLGGLLFGGCTPKEPTYEETFFYVVNQTGQDIQVKVSADGEELFIADIGTEVELPGGYPAKELKVSMNIDTKVIKVQELTSGREKEWQIETLTSQVDGGFSIIIKEGDILLEKGYLPIR